jgi:formylglycine-generating enzyme required for sulfatase activity/outer membrane protein assembly factor BamB
MREYAAEMANPTTAFAGQTNISERVNPKDGAAMVLVPAGEFLMGSKEGEGFQGEFPQRKVMLDDYYIYKYLVTVDEYRRFCHETVRTMPPEPSWKWQDTHPIVNVTWDDARAYAAWAGAALPTEAQFEKAARGADGRTFVWGNTFTKSTCHTSDGKTAPVGSYPTGISPYGALDMAGNVWEWCSDWYDPDYYASAPAHNPPGPPTGTTRVLRGGSWGFNVAEFFRVAYRNRCLPGCRYGDYGFRCVFPAPNGGAAINTSALEPSTALRGAVSPVQGAEPVPIPITHTLAADWPQLGGPAANGISPETGINTDWTTHKPPVLWTFVMHDASGYSHASIVNGTVYLLDHVGNQDIVRALDLTTGVQRWESGYADDGVSDFGYSRGCPVYDNGKLYTFNRTGNANCFDAATGKILWSRNLQKEFNGRKAGWGYTASPLVDGNQAIYVPGGPGASVVALDKNTGDTLWKSGSDAAAHATPMTATIHNVRQYIVFNAFGAVGVKATDGTQLWRHQWTTQHDCNAQSPLVMGNRVFITSGYGVGCAMLEIDDNWKVKEIWKDKELIDRTARPILYQGYIYGTDETMRLICLNPETGMIVWAKEGFGAPVNYAWKDGFSCGSGGLILVDGALLVVSEKTQSMVAVKATPEGYQELGRFKLLVNGAELFTSPSFSNGKLVVRDKKNYYCVDLSPTAASVPQKDVNGQ